MPRLVPERKVASQAGSIRPVVSMAAARASSVGNMAVAGSPAANTVASVGVEARPERIRLEVRMMSSGTVLIVEDDKRIANWVKVYFESAGFSAEVAHDGESGLGLARNLNPNLIILDLMLPRLDGVELCRILRRESDVPIIMLMAREAHAERIIGLDSGADDYIVKPFDPEEVIARAEAVLRRVKQPS